MAIGTFDINNGNIEGSVLDLISLLSSDDRDFLIRSNGDQVKISSLVGKVVGFYFSSAWCGPCRRFTPKLLQVYEERSSKGDFEVVYVSFDQDNKSFEPYFAKMPWLSIPYSDSQTRKRLTDLAKVRIIPHFVILDGTGKVSSDKGIRLIEDFGVEGFPFTPEKINFLRDEREAIKKEQSLSSILVSDSCDFLVTNGGNKIPVSKVEGKMVCLYFWMSGNPGCEEVTANLLECYKKLKEKGENFEVVLVCFDDEENEEDVKQGFETMPWLALPFKDERCQKLVRYFEVRSLPTLIVIGSDGRTLNVDIRDLIDEHGAEAYPFTPEKRVELAAIEKANLEALTLNSLLVCGDRDFVIDKNGSEVRVSELAGKNILLYFSAQWCPPCRAFLPRLVKAYDEIKAKDNEFEVIFISSDNYQQSFNDFFAEMPWLALPFGDQRRKPLSRALKVRGIPAAIAFGSNGRIVSTQAKPLLAAHGANAYPFNDEHAKKLQDRLEEKANGWPEKLRHELHDAHELKRTHCDGFVCDGCGELGHGWSFSCKQCEYDLHAECALKNDEEEMDNHENGIAKEGWICNGDVCIRA